MRQAKLAGERLAARGGVDVIVTSPLRRARQTAEEVAAAIGVPVEEDADFRETDFGAWEGLTFTEAQRRWPDEVAAWLADPAAARPGGESFAAVADRVRAARERLMAAHLRQTVLVVSHVTPIKTLLTEALLAPPAAMYRMHLDVGSLQRDRLVHRRPGGRQVTERYSSPAIGNLCGKVGCARSRPVSRTCGLRVT